MTDHDIPQLDAKGLREFGLTTGAIIIGLFGVVLPLLLGHWPPRTWPWVLGTILILWALISPKTLNPVYHLWMKFGLFMGAINSKIILGVVFYVMMAPMGFIKRLFGSDAMQRQFNPNLSTYRVASKVRPKESMERPF
ncbi:MULTISPECIES: SxtJ family membrane protein [Planktothrix]|uniref:SxtJ n=1 Tax=Planktothrix mougeotii LEGE 06226 TaxID=1828728 RepID=A0ABR9UAQ2_9CYAN|nr:MULTISPECIES: SxtJ family membrane protein [Planktothrix]MBD2484626.1 sxtJ [Planktothrix sp. FACHB-1365]MBE9143261.1 sxtJ [Planktothrix mougeotii LEGE 06226]